MTPDALATLHAHLLTALASAPDETRRLFHGRGRCWPGLEQLTVDWLQGVVLVALFKETAQLEALKQQLLQIDWAQYGVRTVALQHRYLNKFVFFFDRQCLPFVALCVIRRTYVDKWG